MVDIVYVVHIHLVPKCIYLREYGLCMSAKHCCTGNRQQNRPWPTLSSFQLHSCGKWLCLFMFCSRWNESNMMTFVLCISHVHIKMVGSPRSKPRIRHPTETECRNDNLTPQPLFFLTWKIRHLQQKTESLLQPEKKIRDRNLPRIYFCCFSSNILCILIYIRIFILWLLL